MSPHRTLLTPVLAVALLASCVAIQRAPGVELASRPPGARVVVDAEDSGFVTPCTIDIGRAKHQVDLQLDGYQPARVFFDEGGGTWIMHWNEAYADYHVWRFPLWLNMWDFWTPIKIDRGYEPARVFVALRLVEKNEHPRRGGRQ